MKARMFILYLALLAVGLLYSQDVGERFQSAFCSFYDLLKSLLPIAIVVMIVLAGIIFTVGQVMGAETRARANVWATNMLIGAVIAVIVVIIIPWLLDNLVPELSLSQACGS